MPILNSLALASVYLFGLVSLAISATYAPLIVQGIHWLFLALVCFFDLLAAPKAKPAVTPNESDETQESEQ